MRRCDKGQLCWSETGELVSLQTMGVNVYTQQLRAVSLDWVRDRALDAAAVDEVLDEALIDNDLDMLTGSSGSDWFIIGTGDKVTDFKKQNTDGDLITVQ